MAARLFAPPTLCLLCRAIPRPQTDSISRQVNLRPITQAAPSSRSRHRKDPKLDHVVVSLRRPVDRFGKKGTYLKISRGAMRKYWYPKGQARYVVGRELEVLKELGVKFQRDRNFLIDPEPMAALPTTDASSGIDTPSAAMAVAKQVAGDIEAKAESERLQEEQRVKQEAREVDAKRKADDLARALPKLADAVEPNYIFYRAVNTANAQLDKTGNWRAGTPIFGSITVTDILVRLRDSLSEDLDTATIAIDESNVSIKSGADKAEPDRLKSLGLFAVELTIPGATDVFATTVQILPDESSNQALAQAREVARKAAKPRPIAESAGSAFAKSSRRGPSGT